MPIILTTPSLDLGAGSPEIALPGTGFAVPPGVESILTYNGLKLNDRSVIDKFRVTRLDGLADADIRDQREVNPSEHGETAFRSYYGGRSIVLTGRIEAYSLNKLRDMQQAIRTSFGTLEEKPLRFRQPAFLNDVEIWCKKNAAISWAEEQTNYNFYREFIISLRASKPWFVSWLEEYKENFGSPVQVVSPNMGNFRAEPKIVILGPVSSPVITNDLTGESYLINTTLLPGQQRVIDTGKKTIADGNGVLKFDEMDISANWIHIAEGNNPISLTGGGITGATMLRVQHRHTWL